MIGAHPGGIGLTRRLLGLAGIQVPELPAETPDLRPETWTKVPGFESGTGIRMEVPEVREGVQAPLRGAGTVERVLDLGAGSGESVRYLRSLGYDAVGIDRDADADGSVAFWDRAVPVPVVRGEMTALPYPAACFDLCLAECSVAVCGDGPGALREAYRVLRPGGSFLLSDVFFQKESGPCLSMPEPLTVSCWEREIARAGFVLRKSSDETALWRAFFLESLWNDNADGAFCDFFKEAGKAGCGYFLAWLEKPEELSAG